MADKIEHANNGHKCEIREIVSFLNQVGQTDLQNAACANVAQLTGSIDGVKAVYREKPMLQAVLALIHDEQIDISKNAMKILVNVSAEEEGAQVLMELHKDIVSIMVQCINNSDYPHADLACGIMANLSRNPTLCKEVLEQIGNTDIKLEGLVLIFCHIGYNKKKAELHLLASLFTNCSQIPEGRRQLLDEKRDTFEKLLSFIEYGVSKERRKSIIEMIHNCCFEKEYHKWLLTGKIAIALRLVLPLAGPDGLTEEEQDMLPYDLQYLPEDKEREEDADIRRVLIESLLKLCTTEQCRELMRDLNIYLILREYHKWEKNRKCTVLLEDVIHFLIRKESEIAYEDMSNVQIPTEMVEKFVKFDNEELLHEEVDNNEGILTALAASSEPGIWATQSAS